MLERISLKFYTHLKLVVMNFRPEEDVKDALVVAAKEVLGETPSCHAFDIPC
jgi:hypothetical protein